MPNLDDIHYKFFPKAKTAPYGKTLIKFAWVVEIIVAIVGLSIAWFLYQKAVGNVESDKIQTFSEKISQNIDGVIVSLAFVVVAIVELTKIPLATAFYYAAKSRWKIVFIVALILVNISTFETIIQGFELGFYKRSNDVARVKMELEDINNEINQKTLGTTDEREKLVLQEKRLVADLTAIEKKILDNTISKNKEIDALKDEYKLANPQIETKNKQIVNERAELKSLKKGIKDRINNFNEQIIELESITNFKGSITLSRKKQSEQRDEKVRKLKEDLDNFESKSKLEIKGKEDEIKRLESEVAKLEGSASRDINEKIKLIEEKHNIFEDQINVDTGSKRNELTKLQDKIERFNEKTINYENQILDLREKCTVVSDELEEIAGNNQTYRFAIKIKSLREWFSDFSFSSILPWNWGQDENSITEDKMQNERIVSKNCSNASAALLSDDDLNFAFWLWFGTLGFVISVMGTFLALAGLHLQDERMHEIRNRPIREKFGRFFRNIAWIPVYINKLIWAGVKKLTNPKIVKEKVEVEVEKIIEKPVLEEKIVYVDREVPKETIIEKKEIVYVPLPTDDEELLKKGPFKAPDYDKDKKK